MAEAALEESLGKYAQRQSAREARHLLNGEQSQPIKGVPYPTCPKMCRPGNQSWVSLIRPILRCADQGIGSGFPLSDLSQDVQTKESVLGVLYPTCPKMCRPGNRSWVSLIRPVLRCADQGIGPGCPLSDLS